MRGPRSISSTVVDCDTGGGGGDDLMCGLLVVVGMALGDGGEDNMRMGEVSRLTFTSSEGAVVV